MQSALIFHGIGEPQSELPAEEHPYWISRDFFAEIISMVASRSFRLEPLLTFDDGNSSDLWAAELLSSRGLGGKFFMLTGRIGQAHYLGRDDLRALHKAGFEVGLHGRDHVDWRKAPAAILDAETIVARADLADALGQPVRSAAIPFGSYDRRVLGHLRRQNFERIYTSDSGPAAASGLFRRRTSVMAHHGIDDVIALLDDRVGPIGRVRRALAPVIKGLR